MSDEREDMERLYYLRGKFLAEVVNIEESVNLTIQTFFQVEGPSGGYFVPWVLQDGGFSLRRKIDILRKIAKVIHTVDEHQTMLNRLEKVAQKRNDLAHAKYSCVVEVGDGGRTYKGIGKHVVPPKAPVDEPIHYLDTKDLEEDIAGFVGLHADLARLLHQVVLLWDHETRTGDGPVSIVPGNWAERTSQTDG